MCEFIERAAELVEKWAEIFRLGHWNITVRECDSEVFDRDGLGGAVAMVRLDSNNLTAEVSILRPGAWTDNIVADSLWEEPLEGFVVHELLHIVFDDLDSTETRPKIERAITMVERGLARFKQELTDPPGVLLH